MKLAIILGFSTVLFAAGCGSTAFSRPDRKELSPINVAGTTYTVFRLTDWGSKDPEDPNSQPDTVAVYAEVGGGQKVYCGATTAGCEKAIRAFNSSLNSGMGY
jgi:hypothetical protein